MFFWKNVFFPKWKRKKKEFPIKCLTIRYQPIFQNVEISPQIWPEEGWSSPSVVWNLPDVADWPDSSLLGSCLWRYYCQGKEWISHPGLTPFAPQSNFLVSIDSLPLPQRLSQPLCSSEDFHEGRTDAFSTLSSCVKTTVRLFFENQNPSCDVQNFF